MSEDKKEYDLKMQEYAQLLDIRADRIRVSIPTIYSLTNANVVLVVTATAVAIFRCGCCVASFLP